MPEIILVRRSEEGLVNMEVPLHDPTKTLSGTLADTAKSISGEKVTLRQLLELVGEQGMLMFCMILMLPFMLPVSVPGVSTVFSVAVIFIGIGVTLNRIPWLPDRLMRRTIATEHLIPALEKGVALLTRVDRFIRPRILLLTHGATVNRFNGLVLIFAGVLLIMPLGLVPFSNTLPGLAILFLCAGMVQRDGIFILLGYLLNVATVIYFSVLFTAAVMAGQGIRSLVGI
jgi:hypothetical protein